MIDPAFAPYLAQPQQTQRRQSYAPADLGVDPAFAPYIAQPNFTTRVVNSDSAPVDEQSDESIMQQMAGTTLSGLAAFGNLFDLPGSSVRDVLTGNNPLDQWMTPFSADNRTTGRELLTDWGVTRANDPTRWELADVGGFAAEVALDPFTWVGPGAVAKTIGKGAGKIVPKAVKTYAKNSAVGKAVSKVGREFNRHFDSKVMGTKSAKGQAAARELWEADLRGTQESYMDLNAIVQGFAESADPASLADKLRRHAELLGTEGYAGKLDDVEQGIFNASMNLMEGDAGKLAALHAKVNELDDVIGYWPRSMSSQAKEAFEGVSEGGKQAGRFNVFSPNWIGRQKWLQGWKRGTEHVDTVFSDPEWVKMLDDVESRGLGRDTAIDEISEGIASKYGDDIERFYNETDEFGQVKVDADGQPVTKDRYREIAKRIVDVPEFREYGLFQNSALMDLASAHTSNMVRANTLDATYDILSRAGSVLDDSAPAFRRAGESGTTVGDLLKDMNVDLDGASREIMDRMGVDSGTQAAVNRFRKRLVDPELAEDLKSAWKYWDTPDEIKDLGKTWNSFTSLFKAGVLTHPARYVRDVTSAMVRNIERGMWSPKDMYTAGRVLFGQSATGLSEVPAIRMWLEQSGRQVTDENASLAVREMLGNMRASSVYQNTDAALMASDDFDPKSIDSLLETTVAGQRPGTSSTVGQSVREMGSDFIGASPETTRNPLDVAGNAFSNAGEVRRRSQFGPVVVGDRVGRYTDDWARLTPLLHQLRKMSPSQIDEAGGIFNAVKLEMDDIQKMQIDYSPRSFTRTEQALKQVFPFYSFMRGNLAYVASEMIGNRAKKGMFAPGAGLRGNVRAGRLMTGEDDGYAPQYVSETTSVNMGELPDGSRRYLTGLGLMHEDPFSLLTFNKNSSLPDLGDAGIELMSRMNPMIKAPIEYATGESFFQRGPMGGRDLGDMDPLVGRLASNVSEILGGDPLVDASGKQALPMGGVMPVGGGLMEHIIANSPVSRILSTARQITDQRKWQPLELPGGVDVPFGGLAANTLTGARFTDVSLPAQQAVMNDKINAYGRENLDARVYQNVYVPKEVIAEYEKTDPAKARKAKVINRAKQIFKKKREAVEADQDK